MSSLHHAVGDVAVLDVFRVSPASCIRDCPKTKGGETERNDGELSRHRFRLIRGGQMGKQANHKWANGQMGKRCNNGVIVVYCTYE